MNDLDKDIRRILRRYEKSLDKELLFDLDDLIDFAKGRLEELIEFLKEYEGEDNVGIFQTLSASSYVQEIREEGVNRMELSVNGGTMEQVTRELKQILKAYNPVCVGVPYDTENEETEEFIELSANRESIFLVKGFNPYANNYDLEEDGEEISLEALKEIIKEVAQLTLEKNLQKQEVMTWLDE